MWADNVVTQSAVTCFYAEQEVENFFYDEFLSKCIRTENQESLSNSHGRCRR